MVNAFTVLTAPEKNTFLSPAPVSPPRGQEGEQVMSRVCTVLDNIPGPG